ncbi:hypothetical protein U1Q18_009614, partial [Sarracenia purpurea var. burkii]
DQLIRELMSSDNGEACKFEVAFKTLLEHKRNSLAESSDDNHVWQTNDDDGEVIHAKRDASDDKRRREERDEILMHLICRGPN